MFNRKNFAIIALILLTALFLPITMSDIIYAEADGKAEIAMELTQGKVLHEKNADCRLPMASTTKIMTALLICEDCDLGETITVPDEAVGIEGSSIYLKKGEVISVNDLLHGLMLRSGNDAATALAIHHSGSVENFVAAMNEKCENLHLKNTHFANPSGLPDENHYTTARELCEIARYAMSNETFAKVAACKSYAGDYRTFSNKNKLLYSFEGANGVKTGYTVKAGRCLVSSAKRDNMDVICVVLNCYDMYERSEQIIQSCFNNFRLECISADRVFTYRGRPCKLDGKYYICVRCGNDMRYEIIPIESGDDGKAVAKLRIFSSKDLIFTGFLYSI